MPWWQPLGLAFLGPWPGWLTWRAFRRALLSPLKPWPDLSPPPGLLPFVQLGLLTILDVAMAAGAFWLFWR